MKSKVKIYNYVDGNGNQYIITSDNIEYIPVKPPVSSSGVYNGGDYIKREVSKKQYGLLTQTMNIAIKNKKIHIKNRVKMSGLILIQEESKEKSYILSPESKGLKKIENLLKKVISE